MDSGDKSTEGVDVNLVHKKGVGVSDRTPDRYNVYINPNDAKNRLLRPVVFTDEACDAIFMFPFHDDGANYSELWIDHLDHTKNSGYGIWKWQETLLFSAVFAITTTANTFQLSSTQVKMLIEILDEFGTTIKVMSVLATLSQTANNYPGSPPPYNQFTYTLNSWKLDNEESVLPSGGFIARWNGVRITASIVSGPSSIDPFSVSGLFIALKNATATILTAGIGY